MAIIKTTFTGATLAAQASEVLTWLQANATEYFDSIAYDGETSQIVCENGGQVALMLCFTHGNNNALVAKGFLKNGNAVNMARGSTNEFLYQYAIKTSKGIVLYLGENANYADWIFITKTQTNSLCISMLGACSTSVATPSTTTAFISGDFDNSADYETYESGASSSGADRVKSWLSHSAALTSLLPVVMADCSSYTPNFFIMRFTEHIGVVGKVIIGKDEYFSNGYLALKG